MFTDSSKQTYLDWKRQRDTIHAVIKLIGLRMYTHTNHWRSEDSYNLEDTQFSTMVIIDKKQVVN